MRLALLAGVATAGLLTLSPAKAADVLDCTDIGGVTYCDPAAFHVTGAGAGTSKDPVIIHSATAVDIFKNSGGAAIDKPLTVWFAVPLGQPQPTLTGAFFNGAAVSDVFSPIVQHAGVFTSGDFYTFVGCTKCNNSQQFGNFNAGETLAGLPTTTGFTAYSTVIDRGFVNKDDTEHLVGTFAAGTYVVPLAFNNEYDKSGALKKVTAYDAAFTETGLIDPVTTPPVKTPEPATLALLGLGILGIGLTRRRG